MQDNSRFLRKLTRLEDLEDKFEKLTLENKSLQGDANKSKELCRLTKNMSQISLTLGPRGPTIFRWGQACVLRTYTKYNIPKKRAE